MSESSGKYRILDYARRYLLFECANMLFATKLQDIKEIIEAPNLKPFPQSKTNFLGIGNHRGEVIGVVDFSETVSGQPIDFEDSKVLLFQTEEGVLGAAVDRLIRVQEFNEQDLEFDPPVKIDVKLEFIEGVATYQDNMVIIVKLGEILAKEDLLNIGEIMTEFNKQENVSSI